LPEWCFYKPDALAGAERTVSEYRYVFKTISCNKLWPEMQAGAFEVRGRRGLAGEPGATPAVRVIAVRRRCGRLASRLTAGARSWSCRFASCYTALDISSFSRAERRAERDARASEPA